MVYQNIVQKEPIRRGFSCDKKYCVVTADGKKYLLRITPREKGEKRRELFEMLHRVSQLDIPMCEPVEFGNCDTGVYTLYTWVDGKDAREVLPKLPGDEQYHLGRKAGEILKRIHTIPAPQAQEDWHTRFNRKTDYKMERYHNCGIRFDGDDKILEYLREHRDVFKDRPQTFQHGDYHIGNMMLENGQIVIIDFERFDFGDPWEEIHSIVWCAQEAPRFAVGMIDGYFDQKPPMEFWRCLAFYIGSNMLSSIPWAIEFGQEQIHVMLRQAQDVLSWYHNFNVVIPDWYAGV